MFDTFRTVLRYKIWFDLWAARQRTIQAVLTIAIGAFAVGAIFGGWEGIGRDVNGSWASSAPATINLRISPSVPQAALESFAKRPGIIAAEGQMEASVQWRVRSDDPWRRATLIARDNYGALRVNKLQLQNGSWPTDTSFAVERGFQLASGAQLALRTDDRGTTRDYPIAIGGVVYNPAATSAFLGGDLTLYTTRAHFADLFGSDTFQKVTVAIADYTPARAAAVTAQLEADLNDTGYGVTPGGFRSERKTDSPLASPLADTVAGIGFILQSIGVIAVILGLLLIYNTITAIITQQTTQIGELKAVGASSGQILTVYFAVVFVYGALALLLALPLGVLAANGLRGALVTRLGSTPGPFLFPVGPMLFQVALCLLAPLLIAAAPIFQGARITVREAMSNYGLSSGGSWLDELLGRVRWLSRALSLAISNTFRNRQRVILTQLALVGAGVTFMAVMSARGSLLYSVSDLYPVIYRAPIQFNLTRAVSDTQLAQAQQLSAVTGVEVWQQTSGFIRRTDTAPQANDKYPQIVGVPLPIQTYAPFVREGRWLTPEDTDALVIHETLAQQIGVRVGDWVTLSIPDSTNSERWRSERSWQIVGLLFEPGLSLRVMVPRTALAHEIGGAGRGNVVQIGSPLTQSADLTTLAQTLRQFYGARGVDVQANDVDTTPQRAARFLTNVNTISTLLLVMAVIVATVGGIALSGVLSIGVLERRREIGVLRAIGATPPTILSQFIAEGLIMGWLSWLIALALSYPAGATLASVLGAQIQIGVVFQYSTLGVVLWLVLATLIGVVASWSPAQGAIRMSVQESLAYE